MSVINQMLKDLEQRRAQGFDHGEGMLDDLGVSVESHEGEVANNKNSLWLILTLLLVLVITVGAWFLWQAGQQKVEQVAAVEMQPAKISTVVPKLKAVVEVAVAIDPVLEVGSVVVIETLPANVEKSDSKLTATLEPVLEIEPVVDVPIKPVMLVEAILPTPLIADGTQQIISVHGDGFIAPLKVTMERDGGRGFADLEPWQVKLINKTEMQLRVNLGTVAEEWRIIIQQLDNDSQVEHKFSVMAANEKPPELVNAKPLEEAPAKATGVFNKTVTSLTADEQVRLIYAEVIYSLQQGKTIKAKQLLRKLLLLDFTHLQARQTLASVLFKERQYDDAVEVLELGRIQHPQHVSFTLLLARIHTERGQDPAAVKLLEKLEPDVASNSDYYALLAALYQRSAQYQKAASVYEKLLRVYPTRAVWWMGLGLSLQTTERKQEALLAYQKALTTPGLSLELQRFVQRRISLLQQS